MRFSKFRAAGPGYAGGQDWWVSAVGQTQVGSRPRRAKPI